MKALAIAAMVVLVVVCGCVSQPPAPAPPPQQVVVREPFDRVWPKAVAFFANDMVQIQTLEKASGFIASDGVILTPEQQREWVDCGKNALGAYNKTTSAGIRFNVFLQPKGDSTVVRVNLMVRQTGKSPYQCQSTGKFESQLVTSLNS